MVGTIYDSAINQGDRAMERSLYNPQAPPGLKRRETRTQRKLRTSILGRRNIFGKVQRQEEPGGNHTSTATSHPPVSCHGPLCPNQKASRPGLAGVSFQAHRQTDKLEHDRELSGHKERAVAACRCKVLEVVISASREATPISRA